MARQRSNTPEPTQAQEPARAPYNFVPLGPVVPIDPMALPDHDTFDTQRKTGYFDVTVTSETPLYIRGVKRPEDEEAKHNPAFFALDADGTPLLPGSSLRGMLRALVETITFSKMQRMNDRQLFFRSVEGADASQLGREYGRRMTGNVQAGFLVRDASGGYAIHPCTMARVPRALLQGQFPRLYDGSGPNQTPKWEVQHKRVWVSTASHKTKKLVVESLHMRDTSGHQEGVLVVTGDMQKKKYEFVFLLPGADDGMITVPDAMLQRFHDDDQLTRWQQKAFPKDKPTRGTRERDGMLPKRPATPGEPVFYLVEEGKLTFFGRAGMFRLPYRQSPYDLLPKEHQSFALYDMAEGMFGYLRDKKHAPGHKQGTKPRGYASRVFVLDGRAHVGTWQHANSITAVLGAPKPTSFQLYLKQKLGADKKLLAHYDTGGAQLRGRKVYWRQRIAGTNSVPRAGANQDTVSTTFAPLQPGASFTFRVMFENLSDDELGALAWAITLGGDAQARHMLGMGKSFGMGVLRVDAAILTLTDRQARYTRLFDGDGWATGAHTEDIDGTLAAFETHMDEALGQPFRESATMRALTLLLRAYDADDTLFGQAQLSEFKQRPVLPGPSDVVQKIEAARQAAEQEQRRAARAHAEAERAARGYQPGETISAKVSEVFSDQVTLRVASLPGDPLTYTALIFEEHMTGGFIPDQERKLVVLERDDLGDGKVELICRPQTKQERQQNQ